MKKAVVGIMVALACFTTWSCNKDESLDSNKNEMVGVEVVNADTRTPIEEYASGLRMVLEKYGKGAASRSAASDSMMVQEIQSLVSNYVNAYGENAIVSDFVNSDIYNLSEDSIYILSHNRTAFQEWMSRSHSAAFVNSYNAISNGTYYSGSTVKNNFVDMTPGESLIIVTALEIDQYEITNGREIVSAESACNQERLNARNLCLLMFLSDAGTSFLISWTPAFEASLILGFANYAMCIITAENNYQACLNNARGNQ